MGSLVGQVILDQFRVDAFIASGGMGAVYRVWDLKRNVPLAMKVLHADLADDPSIFKRFQREARALQRLAHPNIVPFYGLFQSGDLAFLLERFIDGPSLKEVLRHRKASPLPVDEALVYLKAVSSALGYAHAHGVVHCDVKPGNVMVDRGGSVYLTDFGVARHAESTTTTLGFAGTAGYMAPEQVRGEPVSPPTDVYALGVMLYEMLTGERPFRGDEQETEGKGSTGAERVRWAHLHLAPPDPRLKNPSLPPELAQVILKAIMKDPEARFGGARALYESACEGAEIALGGIADRVTQPGAQASAEVLGTTNPLVLSPEAKAELPRGIGHVTKKLSWRLGASLAIGAVALLSLLVTLISAYTRSSANRRGNGITSGTAEVAGEDNNRAIEASLSPGAQASSSQVQVSPTPTPIQIEVQLNDTDGARMVFVPEGDFIMGMTPSQAMSLVAHCSLCTLTNFEDSIPQHNVGLRAFWIYQTEVTNQMYRKCVEQGKCMQPLNYDSETRQDYFTEPAYSDYPIVHVDWYRADDYCRWAGGRLPTEAEWEKAARGVDGRLFPWGDQPPSAQLANIDPFVGDTVAVGSYPQGASPYGALDMAGNVWEWVADWYTANAYDDSYLSNPTGPLPSDNGNRSGRGGSWGWEAAYASVAFRDWWEPDEHGSGVGFRCALAGSSP